MNLDRHAREFYVLDIATLPATEPIAWTASFDDELTWVAGQATSGYDGSGAVVAGVGWLVAGPLNYVLGASPAGTVVLPDQDIVRPRLRLVDDPELPIRPGPWIYLR